MNTTIETTEWHACIHSFIRELKTSKSNKLICTTRDPNTHKKKTTKNSKISSARTITRTECRSNVTEAKIALVQT